MSYVNLNRAVLHILNTVQYYLLSLLRIRNIRFQILFTYYFMFRYATLRAQSYHSIALHLRILYACIRWGDMRRDPEEVNFTVILFIGFLVFLRAFLITFH